MLIDTHCHFNIEQFAYDVDASIARAHEALVGAVVVVGFDEPSSSLAVELASSRPGVLFAAVGVHPHDASAWTPSLAHKLEEWADNPQVCAIGEIGLDYYRDLSPRSQQSAAFREQLAIARNLHLPVIIHCRDAYEDTLSILAAERAGEIGGVMHCWAGTVEQAYCTLDIGMYLGFGGTITYKNADNVRNSLIVAPLNSILLETDAPYLSPVPHRGKRNEPAYIRLIAEHAAKLRGVSLDEIDETTTENAMSCFPRMAGMVTQPAF